jgi:hypothetical protein
VQQTVLYLGEINDSQRAQWIRAIEVFDEDRGALGQMKLFAAERPLPEAAPDGVQVRLRDFELQRPRQWGACWLFTELWKELGLEEFWRPRLREGTDWEHVLQTLYSYRLLDPGSEWRLHRVWFDQSAMGDLLGEDFSIAAKDTLYRCLDRLLEHKGELFSFLRERWEDLFGAKFDVLLYDLTSTYFESDPPFPEGDKRKFGYSRDNAFFLRKEKLRELCRREGRYLLRSNLCTDDPAQIWQLYMLLTQIEEAFKNLKDDLCLRPIFHRDEDRIEAHIFVAFLAFCLHATLRHKLRHKAPGLTPRSVFEQLSAMQMLDVHFPTTDGRTIIFRRHTAPNKTQKLLLAQLGLELPPQPPPRITSNRQIEPLPA